VCSLGVYSCVTVYVSLEREREREREREGKKLGLENYVTILFVAHTHTPLITIIGLMML